MTHSLEQAIHVLPEFSRERTSQKQIHHISNMLLSGMHIPVNDENIQVISSLVSIASRDRLPTAAIAAVSHAKRMQETAEKIAEDQNELHELWLGDIALRIMRASPRSIVAYKELFGIPFSDFKNQVTEQVLSMGGTRRNRGSSNNEISNISPAAQALVERYCLYLKSKEDTTPVEQRLLTLPASSQDLVGEALFFECLKGYIHEKVYEPFLKDGTESVLFAEFIIQNYKKMHATESLNLSDLTRKAHLLEKDFETMTGVGLTMVGLIRAVGVITSETQQEAAQAVEKKIVPLTQEQKSEMGDIEYVQREKDQLLLHQIISDVGELTQELYRMTKRITQSNNLFTLLSSQEDITTRSTRMIDEFLHPFFSRDNIFTKDPQGKNALIPNEILVRFTHLPDVLRVRSALSVIAQGDTVRQEEFVRMLQTIFSKNPLHEHAAREYSLDYFSSSIKKGEKVIRIGEHIRRIVWEIPSFKNHLANIQGNSLLTESELATIIDSVVEDSWIGYGAFKKFGLSLPGPRAESPSDNNDRYLQDDRFHFAMVADGMGDAEGSGTAASLIQIACQEVLTELWEQGLQYPLSEEEAKKALVDMVARAAEKIFQATPEELRSYLFENHLEEVVNFYATTFTGVLPFVKNGMLYLAVASIGDSRAYLYSTAHESLFPLTRDHSLLWQYLGNYEESALVLDSILSNIEGDSESGESVHQRLSQAINREIKDIGIDTKRTIIQNMIAALDENLVFSVEDIRQSFDTSLYELVLLQQQLGEANEIQQENESQLDEKLRAIVSYFFANRNLVSKSLGIRSGYISEEHITTTSVAPGDRIFLSTDGFHDNVSHRSFESLTKQGGELYEVVQKLHDEALDRLGKRRSNGAIISAKEERSDLRGKPDDGITILVQEMVRPNVSFYPHQKLS